MLQYTLFAVLLLVVAASAYPPHSVEEEMDRGTFNEACVPEDADIVECDQLHLDHKFTVACLVAGRQELKTKYLNQNDRCRCEFYGQKCKGTSFWARLLAEDQ